MVGKGIIEAPTSQYQIILIIPITLLLYLYSCNLFNFITTIKNHLQIYPCPENINYLWNIGFIIGLIIVIQIITGIILTLYYTTNNGYESIIYIIKEVYYGWCIRYIHNNGASFIFLIIFIHIGRTLYYRNYYYNLYIWYTGIIILFILIIISFLGYILSWGQISYWGATVITNLLSPIPYIIKWISGNYYIALQALKRFFIFHFILPFIICSILLIHIYYLHYISSNNILEYNNKR